MHCHIRIHSIAATLSVSSLAIVGMLLCVNTLTYYIGQHPQHCKMHILALAFSDCLLRQEFANSRVADAYLSLAARLIIAVCPRYVLFRPRPCLFIVFEAVVCVCIYQAYRCVRRQASFIRTLLQRTFELCEKFVGSLHPAHTFLVASVLEILDHPRHRVTQTGKNAFLSSQRLGKTLQRIPVVQRLSNDVARHLLGKFPLGISIQIALLLDAFIPFLLSDDLLSRLLQSPELATDHPPHSVRHLVSQHLHQRVLGILCDTDHFLVRVYRSVLLHRVHPFHTIAQRTCNLLGVLALCLSQRLFFWLLRFGRSDTFLLGFWLLLGFFVVGFLQFFSFLFVFCRFNMCFPSLEQLVCCSFVFASIPKIMYLPMHKIHMLGWNGATHCAILSICGGQSILIDCKFGHSLCDRHFEELLQVG